MDSIRSKRIGTAYLPISKIKTGLSVQRAIVQAHVKKIVTDFDVNALHVLTLSEHDGEHYVLDGQHRLMALRELDWKAPVECIVYQNLTEAEEARLFLLLNMQRHNTAFHKFCNRIIEGDPVALDIDAILTKNGFTLSGRTTDIGHFSAVAAAEAVYTGAIDKKFQQSPERLDTSLRIITSAFEPGKELGNGTLLTGVGIVVARYGQFFKEPQMVNRLARDYGSAASIMNKAREIHRVLRFRRLSDGVVRAVIDSYNTGRAEDYKLPTWEGR